MYKTPDEFYVCFNHTRPRFKNDCENVLIYMASEIAKVPPLNKKDFADKISVAIRNYPGNSESTDKTIDNWRTEISAFFGFIEHCGDIDSCGLRASELAESGDLIQFFKTFLYTFQYPGAFAKPQKILPLLQQGVKFKPAKIILQVLKAGAKISSERVWLTKGEICHMIFCDLRVVRDNESATATWERIIHNRKTEVAYDTRGDIIRTAGDIVDYMVIANLLVSYDGKRYYINTLETESVEKFINSIEWFNGYDDLISQCLADKTFVPSYEDINVHYDNWFAYVNRKLEDTDFSTDIIAFLSDEVENPGEILVSDSQKYFRQLLQSETGITTKEIGDFGEALIFAHECARLRSEGAEEVVHLVKRIPTQLAVGYDISSREVDERHKYIEVKTTISSKPVQLYKIHLTRNEWNAAETNRKNYFVYRVMVSKEDIKLFVIQDPVGLYKRDVVSMIPTEGADVSFRPETAGEYEELML